MIFERQCTLNQCKDNIATFEIHPFPILSKYKKRAVKRAVSLYKLMLVFSLLIVTSRFIDQSHARPVFVEIYIRACDKLTIFSKYAREYWRTGSYAPEFVCKMSKMVAETNQVLCDLVPRAFAIFNPGYEIESWNEKMGRTDKEKKKERKNERKE